MTHDSSNYQSNSTSSKAANTSIYRCNSLLRPMTEEEFFRKVVHDTAKAHEVVEGIMVDFRTQTRHGTTYNGPLLGGGVPMQRFTGGLEYEDVD